MSALHCRAYLLLQKQLFKFKSHGLWGLNINIVDDDIFHWQVTISGLKDTTWEGGQFIISLKFTERYNAEPPEVFFQTIPLHPNIDSMSGAVCIDCLDEWNPDCSISYILLSLQSLLSEPCFDNPINEDAAIMASTSPLRYKQMTLDCVLSSNRTPTTYSPPQQSEHSPSPTQIQVAENKDNAKTNEITKLSYEDYLQLWKTVGTTRSLSESHNPFVELLNEGFHNVDYESIKTELNDEVYRQLSEHQMMMYGQLDVKKNKVDKLKANKIQLLKDIHTNKRGIKSLHVSLPASPDDIQQQDDLEGDDLEIDCVEANDLLSWTENLPSDI